MTLKLCMLPWVLEYKHDYLNDELGLTLIFFEAKSNTGTQNSMENFGDFVLRASL